MSHKHSYKVSVKKLQDSQVEIESEIPADEFAAHVADTLAEAVREAEIPGFRKGTAPEKLVREKIGMDALLHDAAREAISHAYGHIVDDEKIDAIGRPEVAITKIAEGNPLSFKLTTAVVPEIKDFDYKGIAKKENKKDSPEAEITDKEFADTLETILKNYAQAMKLEKAPELTDDLVKKFGPFSSVDDFKTRVRTDMLAEKNQKEKEKRRLALIEALTAGVSIDVPAVLVSSEIERMISEMKNDVSRMGLSWSDYLKHAKKTEDDMRKDWREAATKRATLDLAIEYIAKTEKISADEKKVSAELEHVKKDHKDIDLDRAKSYFEQVYQNQAVFEFLESVK
jgi:FKBP-type peptidyl-prolyl cis-trans isomerase (trigger factor)